MVSPYIQHMHTGKKLADFNLVVESHTAKLLIPYQIFQLYGRTNCIYDLIAVKI